MIKRVSTLVVVVVALALFAGPSYAEKPEPDENLGALTNYAIHEVPDYDQGEHASDPSGDGHGPGTNDEPRAGLANVVERGVLQSTIDLLVSLLGL